MDTPIFNGPSALINVYIDPDNISGPSRKKLIKRLEALGASITTDPKYARFILVKAGTPSAEQLAEIWDDKVILSSSWVDACVQAGQLLVEDQQWSRYTATGIVHDVPQAQVQIKTEPDIPLPTPRPTPISPHGSQASTSSLSNHRLPLFIPPEFPTTQPSMDDMVQFASQLSVSVLREAIELQQRVASATMDSLDFRGLVPGSLSAAVPQQPKPTKRHSSSPLEDHKRKRPRQSLFTSPSGEPYEFYVQIDHQNRHELVKTIEKHGGRISSNILQTDFAVLSKISKDFVALRMERQGTNKPAILSSFVYESVKQGVLLEVSDYQFEELVIKQKAPKTTVRKSSNTQAKKQTGKPTTPRHSDPQGSPSPPPQSARGEKYAKGYTYPEMERQYVSTYLPFLLEKDHLLSDTEIAQRLYQKMPHHSTRAWRVYLAKEFKDTLINLRARYSPKESVNSDFQDDVEVITDYFAYEDDDPNESDNDKRFAGLSRKVMPRTASSWREFLSAHQAIVQKRFEEKVAADL